MKFLSLIISLSLCLLISSSAFSATGCNYPTTMDAYTDKQTGDFLTTGDLNSRSCAIEKLEQGPLRPNGGGAAAPAYSFAGDTGTGMYRIGANVLGFATGGVHAFNVFNNSIRIRNFAVTGVSSGNVVFANSSGLQWVNNAGSSTANFYLLGTAGDSMAFGVPSDSGVFDYGIGTSCPQGSCFRFIRSGSGAVLQFMNEASAPGSPGANRASLYAADNGAGKTQLCAKFNTGSPVCFATEP